MPIMTMIQFYSRAGKIMFVMIAFSCANQKPMKKHE